MGERKVGRKEFFFVVLLRGERGWILVGLGCFILGPTKKNPPNWAEKREKEGCWCEMTCVPAVWCLFLLACLNFLFSLFVLLGFAATCLDV